MSNTTEAIPSPDIVFKGTDGNECEAFVAAIRNHAFETGRDEDLRWMLRFATARLREKALRWHARLDPSIQTDWNLFIQALFDQYPSVEGVSEAEITTPVWSTTTFSPAPSTATLPMNPQANRSVTERNIPLIPNAQGGREEPRDSYFSNEHILTLSTRQYDESSTGQQIGLLRLISVDVEGTSIPQYVWRDYSEQRGSTQLYSAMTTINRHEALLVSFLFSSEPHTIGCLNSRPFKTLGLPWIYTILEPEYFTLCTYSSSRGSIVPSTGNAGYVGKAWNVLADGTLQASLSSFSRKSAYEEYEETKFTTTEVHVDAPGEIIRFIKPGALLEQDKPKSSCTHPFFRARIVFEPL